jgi:hydroxymethylpyrimidine/phosphomethylpyrimidine kinase / thiaminase
VTFASHECYGCSVITALTAQNTKGVQGVHGSPPAFVEDQVCNAVLATLI